MDVRTDPEGVIRQMEDNVRGLGLPFLCVNHEYDPSQWEINTRYADAMTAADEAHLLKLAIKETAALNGLVATFIGRPTEEAGRPATTSTSRHGTKARTSSTTQRASTGSPTRPAGSWAAFSRTRAG